MGYCSGTSYVRIALRFGMHVQPRGGGGNRENPGFFGRIWRILGVFGPPEESKHARGFLGLLAADPLSMARFGSLNAPFISKMMFF